jgi:hypothetical protein
MEWRELKGDVMMPLLHCDIWQLPNSENKMRKEYIKEEWLQWKWLRPQHIHPLHLLGGLNFNPSGSTHYRHCLLLKVIHLQCKTICSATEMSGLIVRWVRRGMCKAKNERAGSGLVQLGCSVQQGHICWGCWGWFF